MLKSKIEQVYSSLVKIRCTNNSISIVMKKFHFNIKCFINSFQVRQSKCFKIIFTQKADNIVQQ